MLMRELELPIAPWILRRQVTIDATPMDVSALGGNVCTVVVEG